MGFKINLNKFNRKEKSDFYKKQKEQRKFEERVSELGLEKKPRVNYWVYCDDGSKHIFENVACSKDSMKYSKMCKKCGFEALLWMARSSSGHKGFHGCQNNPSRMKNPVFVHCCGTPVEFDGFGNWKCSKCNVVKKDKEELHVKI